MAGWATSSTTPKLATQFGASAGHSRESRYASDDAPPNATQIKLSDGLNPFDADALAPGVTVQKLDYDVACRRCRLQVSRLLVPERVLRPQALRLPGHRPRPPGDIVDKGFQVQGMHMVVPRLVGVYLTYGRGVRRLRAEPLGGVRRSQLLPQPAPAAGGSTSTSFGSRRARRRRTSGSTPRARAARRSPSGRTSCCERRAGMAPRSTHA